MHGRGKKLNTDKNARSAEDFAKGKKIGRPKQRWVESTINGAPIPVNATCDDLDRMITEETIASGAYVPAHWEKVNAL